MKILEILKRESESSSQAYLYEEGGRWYAYDHSALLISKIVNKGIATKWIINEMYELILRKVEIELSMLDQCLITSCSDTELVIDIPQ